MLGRRVLVGLFLLALVFSFGISGFHAATAVAQQPTIQAAPSGTASTPTVVRADSSVFHLPDTFWPGVIGSLVYGGVGIVLAMLAFIVFEVITRNLHVQQQLQAGNTAVGIVVGALIFGAFYLAAVAIH